MSLDVPRIQALCFDVDGTLSDSDDVYAMQFLGWIKRVSLIRRPEQVARRLVMWLESPGTALMGLSDAIGLDSHIVPVIDWLHRHSRRKRTDFLVVPGVAEMLPRLKQQYPMAAISARDETNTMSFLEECYLTHNFDVILTALSARHTKPYPDPIIYAAEKMGVAPEAFNNGSPANASFTRSLLE